MECTVHGAAESGTQVSEFHFHFLSWAKVYSCRGMLLGILWQVPLALRVWQARTCPQAAVTEARHKGVYKCLPGNLDEAGGRGGEGSATFCCCLVTKSCPTLFVTSWTAAHQDPLSMGFRRRECWSELPIPSPGIFQNQESNLGLLQWQADSLPVSYRGSPWYLISKSCHWSWDVCY